MALVPIGVNVSAISSAMELPHSITIPFFDMDWSEIILKECFSFSSPLHMSFRLTFPYFSREGMEKSCMFSDTYFAYTI